MPVIHVPTVEHASTELTATIARALSGSTDPTAKQVRTLLKVITKGVSGAFRCGQILAWRHADTRGHELLMVPRY